MRKFEKVKRVEGIELKLPERSTKYSAGYDFYNPERIEISPYKMGDKPALVRTGIKAYMGQDEFLMLCNRSSNPSKKYLVIPNGMGIIDADYADNLDNEGEMGFLFWNMSSEPVVIEAGEKLGQGIFMNYLTTEDDTAEKTRVGRIW